MNEILTAKEWLEKEGELNSELRRKEFYVIEAGLMERYANYRSKVLEEEIRKQCFNYKIWLNAHIKLEEQAGTKERENLFELCKKVFTSYFEHFNIQNNIKE